MEYQLDLIAVCPQLGGYYQTEDIVTDVCVEWGFIGAFLLLFFIQNSGQDFILMSDNILPFSLLFAFS